MRPIRSLALFAAAALALTACGDDSNGAASASASSAAPAASAGAAATTAAPAASEAPMTEVPATQAPATEAPASTEAAGGPQRIVSLAPTATEMLFAIGAGPQVVAVDSFSNFPADAPVTDLSGYEPNLEAISKYEPDLVVLSDDRNNVIAGLEALDIEVVQVPAAVTVAEAYTEIGQLGAATGHQAEADELVASMQSKIAAIVADATAKAPAGLSYYHELDNTYYSVTSTTFIGEVYSAFGLTNIADSQSTPDTDGGYPQLNAEYIVSSNPSLIFLADVKYGGESAASVAQRPGWEGLDAVKNGTVVELDDDVASRWGPRIVELYQAVADALAKVPAG